MTRKLTPAEIVCLPLTQFRSSVKFQSGLMRPLARALHRQCKVGAYVPAALFDEVVGVLVTAYWRRGRFPSFLTGRSVAS